MAVANSGHTVDVKERLDKIKSTGYWRVNIRPTKFEQLRIDPRKRCWEIAESCRVYLRGWDYPAVHDKERFFEKDYVQSGADFEGMVELWRLYQSGQFIHYFSCMEDYRMHEAPKMFQPKKADRGLGILSTVYRVTEIFEFATRLAQKEVLQPGLQISIKLVGMSSRELFYWDRFAFPNICQDDEIAVEREFSTGEIIANSRVGALDAILEIFGHFGWEPLQQIIAEDQRRFLERRL